MSQRPGQRTKLSELLITFGLAASISAVGLLVTEWVKQPDPGVQRYAIASEILKDEAPAPYLSPADRAKLALLAIRQLERCLKD